MPSMTKKRQYDGEPHGPRCDASSDKEQSYTAAQLNTAKQLLALSQHDLEFATQILKIVAHLS